MKQFLTLLILTFCLGAIAQNTVGLLSYDPTNSLDGYNLIYPHNQPNVYLLNNCGELVHSWEDEPQFRPGNTAYILEDGSLIKAKRNADISNDMIWAGGGGAIVEKRDWDNNLIWDFELNTDQERLHHDIEILPNGNVLMVAWEFISKEDALAAGRDSSLLTQNGLWPDKIIEYNPDLDSIVWTWRSWDHIIQDVDSTLNTFGVISEHPEKINLNFDTNDGKSDWHHTNSIDFNKFTNQIMISVPPFHEFWIIDHSTTTEEAAGSFGGLAGRGGDLLYRWGNPATYNQGTEEDQKLFYQHDVHFIGDYLDPWHPDVGKIGLFNNRYAADFSVGSIVVPAYDMYENSYYLQDGKFLPEDLETIVQHPDPQALWSTGLSSFQVLNNDNYLLTAGRFGYSVELTPDNEIVWEYKTPIMGGNFVSQGDTLSVNNNLTFRNVRMPLDYVGFEGRDLSSKGYLELNPDSTFCAQILPTEDLDIYNLRAYPNPTNGELIIEWDQMGMMHFDIVDLFGRSCKKFLGLGGKKYYDVSDLGPGVYFLTIEGKSSEKIIHYGLAIVIQRFFVEIAYNGKEYNGWQIQPNAPSVQEEIQKILSTLCGQEINITGCGRTDTGVHASKFYFHVELPSSSLQLDLLYKLNRMSKDGISFKAFHKVGAEAHARFDAFKRSYTYFLSLQKNPFRPVHHLKNKRNFSLEKLNEAAKILLDFNEFFPFCKTNSEVKNYRCELTRAEWIQVSDHEFEFHITANRFLRGMVRLIVGMCINYMNGQISIAAIKDCLETQTRLPLDLSVPAEGLFLTDIKYPYLD